MDFERCSDADLVARWLANQRQANGIDHIGAYSRHFRQGVAIANEISRRGGGRPEALRPLLIEGDPQTRYSVALLFRSCDPDTFRTALAALVAEGGTIAKDAEAMLAARPLRVGPAPPIRADHPMFAVARLPPPAAMTRETIMAQLSDILPATDVLWLEGMMRPAIGLWPQMKAGPDRATGSRLGGVAFAPSGWTWPMVETEPMLFLAQIDCADLYGFAGADVLPPAGIFALFGDHDTVQGVPYGGGALFYWPPDAQLHQVAPSLPPLLDIPAADLAFRSTIDLPDPESDGLRARLKGDAWKRYRNWFAAFKNDGLPDGASEVAGQMLGYPKFVQSDSFPVELGKPSGAYRLLLQINGYTDGIDIHDWGPGGSLYVFIAPDDLAAGRWGQAELAGQFT